MSAPARFVLDGGGIACLGLARRDGARLADLRRPLAVACGLARGDRRFRCYLDRNLPYRLREEDRGLLDLLLAEHAETFPIVPPGAAPEDFILGRADAAEAALVGAGPPSYEAAYLDRYPWLSDPRRYLPVTERDGTLSCGGLFEADYRASSAFDLYDQLLLAL